MRRRGNLFGVGLLGLVVIGMTVWGMGALSSSRLPALLRRVLATTFGLMHRISRSASVLACPCPPRQQVSTRNTEAGAATYRLATDILEGGSI
jgi:hypothetical protein